MPLVAPIKNAKVWLSAVVRYVHDVRAWPCLPAMAILALTAACASAPTNVSTETTVARAAAAAAIRDDARLLQMFDTRSSDTLLIDQILDGSDARRRANAALAIGQNAIAARYDRLRRLLVDPDTGVAANAAFALGLVKDEESVVALGRAFAGAPDPVAREAAWALGEVGDAARTVIAFAIGDGLAQPRKSSTAAVRSPEVRAEMLLAVVKLQNPPVSALTPWLEDTSDVVVGAAAYSIARNRLRGGLRQMLPLADHADEYVRQQVARAFVRASAGDSLSKAGRDVLAKLIVDPSERVRANAARSIGTFGPTVRTEFFKLFRDENANVRVAAAENAGTVLLTDGGAWKEAWASDTTFMVRKTLLAEARRAGTGALADYERDWLRSEEWTHRLAVVEARALMPAGDRVALARLLSTDPDMRVRAASIALLQGVGTDASSRTLATSLLDDPEEAVRASALRVLTASAGAADIGVGINAYERALTDEERDARNAALRYISAVWQRDSMKVSAGERQRLAGLAAPDDTTPRAIVANVTPLAAWASALKPSPRPLSDYEQIVQRYMLPGARQPVAVIKTERGDVTLELLGADAPLVVDAFIGLANRGYYRNTRFHRVVPNFVAQDGDPRGDGTGDPGFVLRDALTRNRHDRGCLGLATSGPDTGGGQYYLCISAQPHLNGHYTVFGKIQKGFDVMDAIVQGDRVISVEIR